MRDASFEWDHKKDVENLRKHQLSFHQAQMVFADPLRVVARDMAHSDTEARFFCIGRIADGIVTVRFTWRRKVIRLIGAGYWRQGKAVYEKENRLRG